METKSNFSETQSAESFKTKHGGKLQAMKHENGSIYFSCADGTTGYISKPVQEKMRKKEPLGTLMVSHVVADGFNGYMLHNQPNAEVLLEL